MVLHTHYTGCCPPENVLPEDGLYPGLYQYLLQPGKEHNDEHKRATDLVWSKKTYRLREVVSSPGNRVMSFLRDGPDRVFVKTQSYFPIMFKSGEIHTAEQLERNKVQLSQILKW